MNRELEESSVISHYRIVRQIGKGGMGEVFLAQDTKLDRQVALKILPAEFAADKDRMSRFVREAKSASALNHPNIITIYEINEVEGKHFIATEFIDGKTLNEYAKANPLDLRSALEIAIQIASALDEAHTAGIVHRDIKPDNVMIRPNGLVKILDFGIAKLSEPPAITGGLSVGEEDATAIKPQSTSPGMIIGTANYMSPEQAKGKAVDARTDIFSFGVVLHEMTSAALPFDGETPLEMIGAIFHQEPKPLPATVPGELKRIIQKCLRKERDERYQTIRDVLSDLKDAKRDFELRQDSEQTVAPNGEETRTRILQASTIDEVGRSPTNKTETKRQPRTYFAIAGLVALILLFGLFGYRYLRSQSNQIESIAVMPFVNESGNQDVEYLTDGMTETLISNLSQLPDLNVKPRSSVFRYKGKETDPKTIARELNVQAVLNGRVVQRGQDLSLFVELIDISLDKVVWSETYNRKQSDLVTLQADIARDVTGKIKTKLSGADVAKVTKTYTTNPKAYQLYLKGNFYRTKYTDEGYKKSLEYYQQAIAVDPNYALAYLGIAAAYDFSNGWFLSGPDSMPKAKAACLKSLELDDTMAETHYLLGKIAFWYDWDWATGERQWKRANELDPAYPVSYPPYLMAIGRSEEAIKAQESVQQRLPLDLNVNLDSALMYLAAGRYDQSIEQIRKALELDPNFWWSYQALGLAYERKKQYPEAIAALEKARQLDANPANLGYLGYVYAAAGKSAEAQRVLEELKELSKTRYVSPYNIASIYAGLNDKDQAFQWLERAYQDHSFYMAVLRQEAPMDNLRPDPRFKDLLKRMHLPE
ncbi:MAG TPA: protein kinase [Pyrinomonadaceae bacterium]|nr:protein kinase [Pyrinomonadaceae bacterium]